MTQRVLVLQDFCLTQRFTDDTVLAVLAALRHNGHDLAVTAFAGFDAQALRDFKARKVQGCTLGYDADLPDWLETLRADTQAQVGAFADRCRALGVACETVVTDTDPRGTMLAMAEGYDWAAMARDATMSHWNRVAGDPGGDDDRFCRTFLTHATIPTLVGPLAPPAATAEPGIVVAYDGSDGAARAARALATLGLAATAPVTLVTVADDAVPAAGQGERLCALLRAHGASVAFDRMAEDDHPAQLILDRVRALSPSLLTIGVFGHRTWRERIFGSVTAHLLRQCPCALFAQR